MCLVKITLNDGEYHMPLEKAFLIPTIRNIIKSRENREYYLQMIHKSNYDDKMKASLMNQLKKN